MADDLIARLEALLAKSGNEATSLFASLLSISVGDRYPPFNLAPMQLKAKTLDALVDQLVGPAKHLPTLFLVEDVHWVDPPRKSYSTRPSSVSASYVC